MRTKQNNQSLTSQRVSPSLLVANSLGISVLTGLQGGHVARIFQQWWSRANFTTQPTVSQSHPQPALLTTRSRIQRVYRTGVFSIVDLPFSSLNTLDSLNQAIPCHSPPLKALTSAVEARSNVQPLNKKFHYRGPCQIGTPSDRWGNFPTPSLKWGPLMFLCL